MPGRPVGHRCGEGQGVRDRRANPNRPHHRRLARTGHHRQRQRLLFAIQGGPRGPRWRPAQGFLKALATQYDNPGATVNTRVHNPSRIAKIPGTWARKGDDTKERPHRRSKVLALPPRYEAVPIELLEALGGPSPAPRTAGKSDRILQRSRQAPTSGAGSLVERARAYLKKLPPSVSGQGGHKTLYKAAMVLVDGFGFDHDTAMPFLQEYNERPDGDPESEHQLDHKLADALAKVEGAGGPSLYLLGPASDEKTGGEGEDIEGDPGSLNIPINNPKRLAEVTLAQRFAHLDGNTLHHWGDQWWAWRDAAYALVEPSAIEDAICRTAEDEFERDLRDQLAAYHARVAAQARKPSRATAGRPSRSRHPNCSRSPARWSPTSWGHSEPTRDWKT